MTSVGTASAARTSTEHVVAASTATGRPRTRSGPYPGGKRFAFAIIDDTDVATVDNVRPLYQLLDRVGIRATKTVWPMSCPEGSRDFAGSETLDDARYRQFVLGLQQRGFEVAFHGATMESSTRERTIAALERYKSCFGSYPRVHANHSFNRENLYWGGERVDDPVVRWLYTKASRIPAAYFCGHRQQSEHWWGDLCAGKIEYVRNLTFDSLNLARINPSMPYRDPRRPLVRWWFSAADAEDVQEFDRLLSSANQEELERSGGFCILATHFGKGFVQDGKVNARVQARLEELSRRDGWFCNVGELLDWLRERRTQEELPAREWSQMQWLWLRDLLIRRLRWKLAAIKQGPAPVPQDAAAPSAPAS